MAGKQIFNFFEKLSYSFLIVSINLNFYQQCLFLHIYASMFRFLLFLTIAIHSCRCKLKSYCGFNTHFQVISDNEHFVYVYQAAVCLVKTVTLCISIKDCLFLPLSMYIDFYLLHIFYILILVSKMNQILGLYKIKIGERGDHHWTDRMRHHTDTESKRQNFL